MNLPESLEYKIEALIKTIPYPLLEKSAKELSDRYRAQSEGKKGSQAFMKTREQKLAYLALRMPATFAAIKTCLEKIPIPIHTLLDVGSGPGTAFLAAHEVFPSLQAGVLLEKDRDLIQIGSTLLKDRKGWSYVQEDMTSAALSSYDLACAAYALSELPMNAFEGTVLKLLQASQSALLIVEPGTPYGYSVILKAREILIRQGAYILAPCTHENQCPMANGPDWCHFSVRINRTHLQRLVKGASLGYEDEKYSYLIVSKNPLNRAESRIVKSPEKHSGHVKLTLCNARGLEHKIISRKTREEYAEAKKLQWGDPYTSQLFG